MVTKREIVDKFDRMCTTMTTIVEQVISIFEVTHGISNAVEELAIKTNANSEIIEALGNDVERLHKSVNMWADPTVQERLEALEARTLGLWDVSSPKIEDDDLREWNEEHDFVSINQVEDDDDLCVVKIGKDQQLLLDEEELEGLRELLNEWVERV